MKICKALLQNQHILLKANKHETFLFYKPFVKLLQSFYKTFIMP